MAASRGLGPPGIRTEVIAADPGALRRQAGARRDAVQEAHEVRGPHAGVAAELVDLVRGRLDEQRGAGGLRLAHRALDDRRMRGAQRPDAGGLAARIPRDDVLQRLHGRASRAADSGCSASRSAASSASAMPAIFIGPGMTPSRIMESTAVSKGAPALTSGATMIALP